MLALPGYEDQPASLEPQVIPGRPVSPEPRVQRELLGRKERPALREPQGLKVIRGPLASKVRRGLRALQVRPEKLVLLDRLVLRGRPGLRG